MSIASEITRINNNIANAYDECETKGATMPATENSANLATTIASIPSSGGADLNDYFQLQWNDMPDSANYFANSMKKLPVCTFGSNVVRLPYFFKGLCIKDLVFPTMNHQGISSFQNMFSEFKGETIDFNTIFDTTGIIGTGYMFQSCSELKHIYNINKIKTGDVTSMGSMFQSCKKLEDLDLSSFNTSKVTNMDSMFYDCNLLASLDVSSFDTSKNRKFDYMFYGCNSLKKLLIPNFTIATEVPSGTTITFNRTFYNLKKCAILDISGMDFNANVGTSTYVFTNCGTSCLQSDGAYANGIPYVYVKDQTAQTWVLSSDHVPSSWTTDNVVIKQN